MPRGTQCHVAPIPEVGRDRCLGARFRGASVAAAEGRNRRCPGPVRGSRCRDSAGRRCPGPVRGSRCRDSAGRRCPGPVPGHWCPGTGPLVAGHWWPATGARPLVPGHWCPATVRGSRCGRARCPRSPLRKWAGGRARSDALAELLGRLPSERFCTRPRPVHRALATRSERAEVNKASARLDSCGNFPDTSRPQMPSPRRPSRRSPGKFLGPGTLPVDPREKA